jgi:putative sterol carrier protein
VSSTATAEFFEGLRERGYEPLLEKVTGSARFDIVDNGKTERWLVTFDKGHIDVARRNERAETVVTASRESFERAVAGHLNVTAAALRGEVKLSGDPRLLVRLQRLFPRPEDGRETGAPT